MIKKDLPCNLVLAGGAGFTVRRSIGSSMLGFMLFQPRKPTRKGNNTTETARMICVVGVFASATSMRALRQSCQHVSVDDTHMNIPISTLVASMPRTLKGSGG